MVFRSGQESCRNNEVIVRRGSTVLSRVLLLMDLHPVKDREGEGGGE